MSAERRDDTDLVGFLIGIPLFSGFTDEALADLASRVETIALPAGGVLMAEGEPGDAIYLVRTGRLRASVRDESGNETPVGEAGPGSISGEMALLTDEPRSATVKAVRDTVLLRLGRPDFLDIVRHHPASLLEVTRTLAGRLRNAQHAQRPAAGIETVALLPASRDRDVAEFAVHLGRALEGAGPAVETVDRHRVEREFGPSAPDAELGSPEYATVSRWLGGLEENRSRVLYIMDPQPSEWSHRCARQADVILVVAAADGTSEPGHLETVIGDAHPEARRELVLLQAPSVDRPSGTTPWIEGRDIARHHHVKRGDMAHHARVVRMLTGQAVGLVFSGGGAKAFAHMGIIRALQEAGIPIDMTGGASSGATTACGVAFELPADEIVVYAKRAYRKLVDYTVPMVALASGAGVDEGHRFVLGEDTGIEDFWLNYFCVATDLTSGSQRIFDSGPAWWAVRASVSIPGVLPPVADAAGHALVDGGLLDNLPVDIMASRMQGFIVASDLRSTDGPIAGDLSVRGVVSGWSVAARRLLPFVQPVEVPGIAEILLRSIEVSSRQSRHPADYTFRPPVEAFGALDVAAADDLVEVGYRYALRRLEEDPIVLP